MRDAVRGLHCAQAPNHPQLENAMTSRGRVSRITLRAVGALQRAGTAMAHVRPVLSGLAVGVIGMALGLSTSAPRSAHASATPAAPLLRIESGPSCPLSVGDQVKAARAFGEMMPIFRHPRCSNCHGDFDIRADKHPGSGVASSSGLDPRALLTALERKKLHAGCGDCHDNVEGAMTRLDGTQLIGWLVAPQPMLWDGKSDEELCMQMKRFERTGDQFVDHLTTDHREVQFIKAAFNGDRALGADGLKDNSLVAEKPPGRRPSSWRRPGRG